jgi:hypothetical protein
MRGTGASVGQGNGGVGRSGSVRTVPAAAVLGALNARCNRLSKRDLRALLGEQTPLNHVLQKIAKKYLTEGHRGHKGMRGTRASEGSDFVRRFRLRVLVVLGAHVAK